MTGIYAIIGIVMLVFGILQIVLFFKLWGMTNDVGQIKGLLSNLSTQKATAAMSSHDLEQTSPEQKTEQKVVGKWPVGTLVVHTATWQQMRIKEITPDHKYVCTQGNLVRGPYTEGCLMSYEDYVTTILSKNNSSGSIVGIVIALICILIIAILFFTA
jgi:hypothetical protein|nr:MAG TPA: hypothetical protein [Caudoviricetes sp.]